MNPPASPAVKTELRRFLAQSINLDGVSDAEDLFAAGIVNSLFAVQLTTFLETRFGLEIGTDDLDLANFRSIDAAAAFVARKTAAAGT